MTDKGYEVQSFCKRRGDRKPAWRFAGWRPTMAEAEAKAADEAQYVGAENVRVVESRGFIGGW